MIKTYFSKKSIDKLWRDILKGREKIRMNEVIKVI